MAVSTTAAVLTAPGRIELVDRTLAELAPGQVLVRINECGICSSDVDRWNGTAADELPWALGHEGAGVIEAVGERVTRFAPGDHVAAWMDRGGFAERAMVDAGACVPVPAALQYPAVAEPLACVVNAVERAAPALGDDVVVVGAGYMGNLVQLVTALKGPRSITVGDVRPEALARAAALGATRVVDVEAESLAEAVAEVTGGGGADVMYEVTGVERGLALAGSATRSGGKLVVAGYHQGADRRLPLGAWNWNALEIVNAHVRDRATIMAGMRAGLRLATAGLIDAAPLVTHRFPLSRIAAAFHMASERPKGFVKGIVEPALPA